MVSKDKIYEDQIYKWLGEGAGELSASWLFQYALKSFQKLLFVDKLE